MAKYKYKKKYSIKKEESLFKKRFFWLLSLLLFFILGILYFFLFSPIFQIKEINIAGIQKISKEDVLLKIENNLPRTIFLFKTTNIFLVHINQIEETLSQDFPQIESVMIDRKFPAALNIEFKEREGRALWCDTICYLVDKEGVIFEEAVSDSELVRLQLETYADKAHLGQNIIQKDLLSSILEIESLIKERAGFEIGQAIIVSNERVNFKTKEGWEIYFNLREDFEWQATKLSLVLEKEITPEKRASLEYIDLRFTRVYYK